MTQERHNCPWCFDGRHPLSLSINRAKGVFFCWRRSCGKKGGLESLPDNWLKTGVGEEIPTEEEKGTRLARSLARRPIWGHSEGVLAQEVTLPEHNSKISPYCVFANYLISRDINPRPLIPFIRKHSNYLLFPIYEGERIVYYVGRKIYGSGPRYKNYKGEGRHIFVPYGMPKKRYPRLIITEGVFDALSVYQKTDWPVVAMLGATYAAWKITDILEYVDDDSKVVIFFDPKTFGDPLQFCWALKPFVKAIYIKVPKHKDPGDMCKGELLASIAAAIS